MKIGVEHDDLYQLDNTTRHRRNDAMKKTLLQDNLTMDTYKTINLTLPNEK